jgi:hypothetical protein
MQQFVLINLYNTTTREVIFDYAPLGKNIKDYLFLLDKIPFELIQLQENENFIDDEDLILRNSLCVIKVSLKSCLNGGKGGFGALLRSSAKQKGHLFFCIYQILIN